MNAQIVDFRRSSPVRRSAPAADRLHRRHPQQTIANYFTDATQQFIAGIWSSTRGKWRIRYSESEFCCLTRGRVALENWPGQRWEFGPGEGFVVPAGLRRNLGSHRRLHQVLRDLRGAHLKSASAARFTA